MKKIIFFSLLLINSLCIAYAQNVIEGGHISQEDGMVLRIPLEYSYDKTPYILMINHYDNVDWDNSYSSHEDLKAYIYDENLNLERTIDLNSKMYEYTVEYEIQEREILSVDIVNKETVSTGLSFSQFVQQELTLNPNSTPESIIVSIQENGDSLITFADNCYQGFEEVAFFHPEIFGKTYPRFVWVCSNGVVLRTTQVYSIAYSEWRTKDTEYVPYSKSQNYIVLNNINLNNQSASANEFFIVSQTLFNDDPRYEYIVPKYKLAYSSASDDPIYSGSTGYGEENIELTKRIAKSASFPVMSGFQVVSENGNIIADLNFDNDFSSKDISCYCNVITIGRNKYIAFYNSKETIFYKINNSATVIEKATSMSSSMVINPSFAEKNSTIKVAFGDDNKSGSTIHIYSLNGQIMKTINVPQGEQSASFTINNNTGIYQVVRSQPDKPNEVKQIIIK